MDPNCKEFADAVVISGMSAKLPKAHNIQEFADNLYTKVDCTMEPSVRYGSNVQPDVPKRLGLLYDINHFDAGYFGVSQKQAHYMDPMCRLVLECTYEAILDAGLNLKDFHGKKVAVCVGVSTFESEHVFYSQYGNLEKSCCIVETVRSIICGRLHYWLKTKGDAIIGDTACASSHICMEHAFKYLINDDYDYAIVVGSNLCLNQTITVQFARLGVLSKDGVCRPFDDNANGYVRSEGIGTVIMQKARTAKRIYAEVVYAKVNSDGYKSHGITFPSREAQKDLLTDCYKECGIEPSTVTYVEAHGTGTHVGDPEELNTITDVFCTGRNRPLYIGSVKSNIGHNEPVSGVCGIAKVLIGFHTGLIPPNINYETPRKTVQGLLDKKLIVVTEPTPWPDNKCLVGISSFGFGGANGHLVVRRFNKHKVNDGSPKDDLPRLVCASTRTDESLANILNDLKNRKLDAEYIALYHEIYKNSNAEDNYRGYVILNKEGTPIEGVTSCIEPREITLYFGKEEEGLARYLGEMQAFCTFATAIRKARGCLKKFNSQLVNEVIENFNHKNRMHVVLGSFIMQIGIYDTLKLLKANVKNVYGEGIGSLLVYYSKGALNTEEVISLVYLYAKEAKDELKKFANKRKLNEMVFLNGLYCTKVNVLTCEDVVCCGKVCQQIDCSLQIFNSIKNDSIQEFLHNLGTIFTMGCDLHLAELYPKINYPVSLQTPMISSLLRWNHNKFYKTITSEIQEVQHQKKISIEVNDPDWNFVQGHTIDGRNLFPATGFLYLIWDLFASMSFSQPKDFSVIFQDVKFIRAVNLPKDGQVFLDLSILQSGEFEISEDGVVLVSGKIATNKHQMDLNQSLENYKMHELELKSKDVYKELRLRSYNYSGHFKGIKECCVDASKAKVEWKNNWIAFLDNLLQVLILKKDTRNLYVPVGIDYMTIDVTSHYNCVQFNKDEDDSVILPVIVDNNCDIIRSGGVQIIGLSASAISKRKPRGEPVLESYKFMPNNTELTIEESMRINTQMILENVQTLKVKVAELLQDDDEDIEPISPYILNALGDLPLIQPDVTIYTKTSLSLDNITVNIAPFTVEENYLLVIGVDLLKKEEFLKNLAHSIKPNTYIVSRERTETDLVPNDLQILTIHSIGDEKVVLMQKPSTLTKPIAISLNEDINNFHWLLELQNAVQSERDIIVYTQNQPINGILGLINCIRKEAEGKRIKCLLLDRTAPNFNLDDPFYKEQLQKDLAINVYQEGVWGTYRHTLLQKEKLQKESQYSYANTKVMGDLSSFSWLENYPLCYDSLMSVKVHYSSLNFKDVMIASGRIVVDGISRIEQNCLLGIEYSGIDYNGRRVMGLMKCGAISTEIIPDPGLTWLVPEQWSLADAATVPCVYATSLYAMLVVGKLKRGESILIHSGTGGVGQAAINIALHYDCEIFTTVGTQKKKEFILKNFPRIKESHIGNSRDTSFAEMILTQTKGKGVDLVLNSLAEEKLQKSIKCLTRGGRFLEIGKFDLQSNNPLYLGLINENKSFNGVMLDKFFVDDGHSQRILHALLTEGIKSGMVKPLIKTVFDYEEIEAAFRYMATGKHMGKVLISIRKEDGPEILPKCTPRFYCNPHFCNIILGGLGGFGLELADWLVLRGARQLILTSRNGIATGYQRYRIKIWEKYGVNVTIRTDDITTHEGCLSLIEAANKLAPIENIFNLAVVLRDKTLTNQTVEDFKTSLAPKAFATQYLDKITRNACKNLRNFVVFSSVSCGRGNGGQANYGMANSIMERICEKRQEDGYPGLAIQWGAVGDVGLVAEVMDTGNELVIAGTLQQKISNCLETLDVLLNQNEPIVASMVVAEKKITTGQNIIETVANILGIRDVKTVSHHIKLPEMGMDSMMGVEIKQTLEREYDVFLTPQDIRNLTFARLKEISEEKVTTIACKEEKTKEGLELLLRFVIDEADSTNLVVNLSTNSQNINNSQTIYFFPGYEGTSKVFNMLSSKLRINAVSFQYSIENLADETITDMARSILPDVLSNLGHSRSFVLAAHSFGTLVALELTSMLEELGYSGKLILIDGSPSMMKSVVEQQFQNQTLNEIQINLLFRILSYMFALEDFIQYKANLEKCETYDDKISFLMEKLPTNIEHSKRYQRLLAISLYKRLLAIKSYKPSFSKIRSLVHLYKAKTAIIQDLEDDHGLSNWCHQKVNVKYFDGDHVSILDNEELAFEINNQFNDDISDKTPIIEINRHNGIMQEAEH